MTIIDLIQGFRKGLLPVEGFVTALYAIVLRRPPDESGYEFYVRNIKANPDPVAWAINFVVGAQGEFREREDKIPPF